MKKTALLCFMAFLLFGCFKNDDDPMDIVDESTEKSLMIKFKFDPNQERLGNFGEPAPISDGHAGQTPDFEGLSVHFIELVPTEFTPYKEGQEVYKGEELPASNSNPFGFNTAIDFDKAIIKNEDELFFEIPINQLAPGTYKHLRASVSFQKYNVTFNLLDVPTIGDLNDQNGTLASFLGYNTHINSIEVREQNLEVNETKLQGFWAFETGFSQPYTAFNQVFSGQAPSEATTVVNPFPNAPIPQGSCVVSGSLDKDLVITGEETEDIILTLSFSINQSFEWEDYNDNGQWDIDAGDASNTEPVVDMGLRGLKVLVD